VTSSAVANDDDDQLFYTKAYLNEELRNKVQIKLDHRADLFQNLNGAVGELLYPFEISKALQGVSRLVDITAGGDFLGKKKKKSSYKHVSNFGWLQSCDCLKLRIEGSDY
jgi:hypothetical protein